MNKGKKQDTRFGWRPDYVGLTFALAQWTTDAAQLNDHELDLIIWHLLNRRNELIAELQRRKEQHHG
jgi:hypothetical protein